MESTIQRLRRTALENITEGDLDKARILIAALIGTLFTDRAEEAPARKALSDLFTADEERLRTLVRIAYDKAQRVESRRRNEESTSRSRFPDPRFRR